MTNLTITHEVTARRDDYRGGQLKKVRAYVSLPDDLMPEQPAGLEYTVRGENVEMDKAWDRHNREVVKAWRAALLEAVKGTRYEHVKWSFSKHAGCSCPCSPGFVGDRAMLDALPHVASIFVGPAKA